MHTFATAIRKELLSECSAVGSALRSGRRGRAFESPHSDRSEDWFTPVFVFCLFLLRSPLSHENCPNILQCSILFVSLPRMDEWWRGDEAPFFILKN